MPDFDALTDRAASVLAYLPWWAGSLIVIVACCLVVMPLHGVAYRAMKRAVAGKSLFWRSLVSRTHGPSRFALIGVAISIASTTMHLSWEVRVVLNQILLVAFVTLTGWCCATALHIATVIYLRRFKLDAEDNLLARKHFTQMCILERAAVTLVGLITVSVAQIPELAAGESSTLATNKKPHYD